MKGGGAESADIYINDLSNETSWFVATTRCYDNQQASLVTLAKEGCVNSNDIVDSKIVICDLFGEIQRTIPGHYFSASKDCKFLSMICFETFSKGLDGYGYKFSKNSNANELDKTLRIYDIIEDKIVYQASIDFYRNSSSLSPDGLLGNGFVYFSHTNFSPCSKKSIFCFAVLTH